MVWLRYLFEELVPFEAGDADFDGSFHEAGGEHNAMELAEGASGDGGRQGLHFRICCRMRRGATAGKVKIGDLFGARDGDRGR
jgi:hypothetical protein